MRAIAIIIIMTTFVTSTGAVEPAFARSHIGAGQEADAWRKVAESIPLGTKVKVQTFEGRRFAGTLMRVDSGQILLKRNTRRPEPAVSVSFDEMSKLERDTKNGSNLAKAAVIGLAAGAGVILSMFVIALQFD
jgi:hypothetical protein